MNEVNTGNKIVDEVSKLNIQGNIIPQNWYYTIVNEHGKPHYLAIAILAVIVNGYQAEEVRNQTTGEVVDYHKKFEEEMFEFYYSKYEQQFGESHSTIKRAIVLLEKLGIIKRVFETITVKDVRRISNVVFIDLNLEVLKSVTFPEKLPERNLEKRRKPKDDDVKVTPAVVKYEQMVSSEMNSPIEQIDLQQTDLDGKIENDELQAIEVFLQELVDEMYTPVQRNEKIRLDQRSFIIDLPLKDSQSNKYKRLKMNIDVDIE